MQRLMLAHNYVLQDAGFVHEGVLVVEQSSGPDRKGELLLVGGPSNPQILVTGLCVLRLRWLGGRPLQTVFYLLCKTHKLTTICQGRWSGRPVVGLHTWTTTTASVVLGVDGTILLKLDCSYDEMSTPLRDLCDLVSRVHTLSELTIRRTIRSHRLIFTQCTLM